jgi:hypothetical protein
VRAIASSGTTRNHHEGPCRLACATVAAAIKLAIPQAALQLTSVPACLLRDSSPATCHDRFWHQAAASVISRPSTCPVPPPLHHPPRPSSRGRPVSSYGFQGVCQVRIDHCDERPGPGFPVAREHLPACRQRPPRPRVPNSPPRLCRMTAKIGLAGLAVMGQVCTRPVRCSRPSCATRPPCRTRSSAAAACLQNLALNIAEKGFDISVYNRSYEKTEAAVARAKKSGVLLMSRHGQRRLRLSVRQC